jgi:hypothetical protein
LPCHGLAFNNHDCDVRALVRGIRRKLKPVSAKTHDQKEQRRDAKNKKADVAEHPEMHRRIGLLIDEPPGRAGLPFI